MSKRYTTLLWIVLGLFVLLYALLCGYSRLATDDFYFIWDVQQHGIIKGVTSQYMEWCGRYAATFFMDAMYWFGGLDQSRYFIFPFLSLPLLIGGLYRLFGLIASAKSLQLSKKQVLLLSLSFTALLYFLSIDIGETWFWYCSLSSYLWSIIAFVWGTVFLFGNGILRNIAAALCFIYIGGSSEVYCVIYGLLLFVFLCDRYLKQKNAKLFFADALNRRILFISGIFALAFSVFLIAPGNYLRDELFPTRSFSHAFFITAKSIIKFSFLYLPSKLAYIIAFAMPFFFIGKALSKNNTAAFSLQQLILRASALFGGLLLLFFYMVAYVMIETGPARVWFIVSFLLAAYCCFVSFCTGYAGVLKGSTGKLLQYGSVFLGLLLLLFHLCTQVPTAQAYAHAADARIMQLEVLKQRIQKDTVIRLDLLPSAGMLYSGEIQTDTAHFTNKELRLAEGLKFHVVTAPHDLK